MLVRYRRFRRYFQRQRTLILWSLVFAGVGAGLLAWAVAETDLAQDILVSLGSSLVMVALVDLTVVDPILEAMYRNLSEEHKSFGPDEVTQQLVETSGKFEVLETWTAQMLLDDSRARFLAAADSAARRGLPMRLLLCDPACKAGEQRRKELADAGNDIDSLIQDDFRYFYELQRNLPEGDRERLQVRVYSATLLVQAYRFDDKLFVADFPADELAYKSTHVEVHVDSAFGQFVMNRFTDLWERDGTVTLHDYMTQPIKVALPDGATKPYRVQFANLADAECIDIGDLNGDVWLHGRNNLRIATTQGAGSEEESWYSLAPLEPDDDLVRAYTRKYGPGGAAIENLVRLLPT